MNLRLVLTLIAVGCAVACAVIGFDWPVHNGQNYFGWLGLGLLAWFARDLVKS